MGVLTHLDKFKDSKKLKTTKKTLRQRFWTEIYQGAKLFYLSGLINGKYPKNEIINIARFISVMKFRPLLWRNHHPYILSDRVEDITDPDLIHQDAKCDRKMTFYGFVRGTNLKHGMKVHIPGVGDHTIESITSLPDPVPLPDKVKRSLSEKQKLLYAPMSDVSGVLYDKDAVYVNVPSIFNRSGQLGTGEQMVLNLQDAKYTLDGAVRSGDLRIFTESEPIQGERTRRKMEFATELEDGNDDEDMDGSEDEALKENNDIDMSENSGSESDAESVDEEENAPRNSDYDDSDSDMSDNVGGLNWKSDLIDKASSTFKKHQSKRDLLDIIYNPEKSESESSDDNDEVFRLKKKTSNAKKYLDSAKVESNQAELDLWEDESYLDSIRSKFIVGGPDNEDGEDETAGDFEDLEDISENPDTIIEEPLTKEEELEKKKEVLKLKFDAKYDGDSDAVENDNIFELAKEDMAIRQGRNEIEFKDMDPELRTSLEGFRPGNYVRIVIDRFPCEFINTFSPLYPIVLGGVLPSESALGHLQVIIYILTLFDF